MNKNNLENSIKDIITEKLNDGTVEKMVAEQFEKGIEKALSEIFGGWGPGTKAIQKHIESVILPYLEGYDYSRYIVKLDAVLVQILEQATIDNRKLLENFKHLMAADIKEIKVTDLFSRWMEHVSKNIETNGLEVDFDEPPTYKFVPVTFEIIHEERPHWDRSSFEFAKLLFECEHDPEMNYEIRLSKWGDMQNYDMQFNSPVEISSLRRMSHFDVFIMALAQNGARLIIDSESGEDDVEPEATPEVSVS